MEKLVKKEKDISFVLDMRTITKKGSSFILTATKAQCDELALFYELPAINQLTFEFEAFLNKEGLTEIRGFLKANVVEICVVSTDKFEECLKNDVTLLFSEDEAYVKMQENRVDFSPEEELVEYAKNGRIYFLDVVREQLGLMLNPFPKKTDEPFSYYEEKAEEIKENPFSVLKHLTK